jgi:hypothetical protein
MSLLLDLSIPVRMMTRSQQTKRRYSCLVFLLACNHHYYFWRPQQQQHHVARAFGVTAVNRRSSGCKATAFENAGKKKAPFRLENSKEPVVEVTKAETASGKGNNHEPLSFWSQLSDRITQCLLESDRKRDDGFDGASTGWTSWVEEKSARALQECFDRMKLRSVRLETGSMDDRHVLCVSSFSSYHSSCAFAVYVSSFHCYHHFH